MALEAEVPVGHGVVAFFLQQGNRQEFAFGFAHFAMVCVQMVDMEPVAAPGMAQVAFGLGDLVGVVGKGIVYAAAVQIQIVSQVLHGDAGALNVPAGIAHAPGGVPFQGLVLEFTLGEPENKVVFISLVGVFFHTLPDANGQILFVVVVEDIVFFQLGGVEVHVAPGEIGIALLEEGFDHVDIFGDAVGGRLHYIRPLDVQLVAVGEEGIGVEFCHLHDGFMLPGSALEHLVFAGVGIGGQVAYVRDVHHPLDTVAHIPQALFQYVFHDVGPQIADMGIVIHRGAAGVHFYICGILWGKELLFVGKGIVKIHICFLLTGGREKENASCLFCPKGGESTKRRKFSAVPL